MGTPNATSSISSIDSRRELATRIARLTDKQARELEEELRRDWSRWARANQLPPAGDWRTWLLLAGRGFGKTRTGAETVRAFVESGRATRVALVAPTAADARDVMVEGESGILAISPPWARPHYEPSKRRLTWPNGALATLYSADEPERLRGPQHDLAWADELGSWRYPTAWDMLMLGLRLGRDPRAIVTTTPKPSRLIRELVKNPTTSITRGSTYDNRANLAPAFIEQIISKYEGTRLGRQELYADLLEDVPGALWSRDIIDAARATEPLPDMRRVVVAIDPAVTSGEDSDETGIIVAGLGQDGLAYVLADRSCRASPDTWAQRAIDAFDEYKADRVIAEVNNGGDLVENVLRTVRARVPYKAVHASRGKRVRAEPVAALYEQGRVKHALDSPALEDQMATFVPDNSSGSPDRVDALVWALTELMLASPQPSDAAARAVALRL
jgi:predicted phage terminase large subunit-like protein